MRPIVSFSPYIKYTSLAEFPSSNILVEEMSDFQGKFSSGRKLLLVLG